MFRCPSDAGLMCTLSLPGNLWREADSILEASPDDGVNFRALNRREANFPGSKDQEITSDLNINT